MSFSMINSLKIKAKLLQKSKKKSGKEIQLKDAFHIIAKSQGFGSWRELKEVFEATEHFCPAGSSAHWKVWYANYHEACSHLERSGGFLLPYGKQFFICESEYLEFLGIPLDDADLKLIGPNWVEPRHAEAYGRLIKKLKSNSKTDAD